MEKASKKTRSSPPDPVFVLREATCALTAVQFLQPFPILDDKKSSSEFSSENSSSVPVDERPSNNLTVIDKGQDSSVIHKNDEAGLDERDHSSIDGCIPQDQPHHTHPLLGLTTHIAAGTQEGHIIIWNLKTKQRSRMWLAHPNTSVMALRSVSATHLVSMGRRDAVKLWHVDLTQSQLEGSQCGGSSDLATPECMARVALTDHLGFCGCDVFLHHGTEDIVAAIPGSEHTVSVWNLNKSVRMSNDLQANINHKVGEVMQLKWIRLKEITLLVAYESGHLCLWDWHRGVLKSVTKVNDNPLSVEYNQTIGQGVVGTVTEKMYIFTVSDDMELSVVSEVSVINDGVGCCVSRPDGKIYATGGWDGRIRLFSWRKWRPLAVLSFHTASVADLHYAPSGVAAICRLKNPATPATTKNQETDEVQQQVLLAAASADGSLSLWSLY